MSAVIRFLHDPSNVEAHVAPGEVTTLKHEVRDHPMELGSSIAKTLLASAKGTEILGRLRSSVLVKIEVDAAGLIYCEISQGSDAVNSVEWKDCSQWQKVGQC